MNSLNAAITKRYVEFQFYKTGSAGGAVNIVKLKVDSGAEINVMPLKQFQELYPYMIDANGLPLKEHLIEEDKQNAVKVWTDL